jgi:protein SCO1/2
VKTDETKPATGGVVASLVGKPWFWVIAVALLFSWPIVRSVVAQSKLPPPRPVLGAVPDFTLINQDDEPFGSAELRGKVWIAQAFSAADRDSELDKMAELQHRSRGLGQAFHLVSFTVAPEIDTVAVIAEVAREHKASRRVWTFVTGARGDVDATVLALTRGEDPRAWPPASFILVDRFMKIRGVYDLGEDGGPDRILRDAGLLVNRGS